MDYEDWRGALKYLNDKDLEILTTRIYETIEEIIKLKGEKPKEKTEMDGIQKEQKRLADLLEEQTARFNSYGLKSRYLERVAQVLERAGEDIQGERQPEGWVPRAGDSKDAQTWKEQKHLDRIERQAELVSLRRQYEQELRKHRFSDSECERIAQRYRKLGIKNASKYDAYKLPEGE